MSPTAHIALGSNLGDRQATLEEALRRLAAHPQLTVRRTSRFHETAPVGGPTGQGLYLNAAAEVLTDLSAGDLLQVLHQVEDALGRVRLERDGPRTLDLDLLLYGLEIHDGPACVPHPRMHERLFVLRPLAEIAPLAVHPRLGSTVLDLLRHLEASSVSLPRRELSGLRACVTGSTSGIGRAMVRTLAAGGADVVIHGRRSPTAAAAVVSEARNLGVRAEALMADFRDPQAVRGFVTEVWNLWDGIDVWVNNAGADTLTGEAAEWSFERKLEELWSVDVVATMHLSRAIGEKMRSRGRGSIVTVGWDQAETGMEGDSGQLFSAIKGAVMAFTRSLALTLAPEVRVNGLAPGWIRTAWGEGASEFWQERVRRETPLQRWGTPDDVAAALHWLASPASAYVTGQILRVNGGAVR